MDSIAFPEVITAIADPEFEGMVSGTLYSQGWNVIARALDASSLNNFLKELVARQVIVIYSTDLPGLTPELLVRISTTGITFFGFVDAAGSSREFLDISDRPQNSTDLMGYIRGNIRVHRTRTPMLQTKARIKSQIIGVGSAGHHTGNTTAAINIAQESALLGHQTLLVDANFDSPAIAEYLQIRKLSDELNWKDHGENLSVMEVTHSVCNDFANRIMKAASEFDTIVLDLGSIRNFATDLTDRRWGSTVKIWTNNYANYMCVTSMAGVVSSGSLRLAQHEFNAISLRANLLYLDISPTGGKSARLAEKKSMSPNNIREIPWDPRGTAQAIKERSALALVNERSVLRKEYVRLTHVLMQR